MVSWEVANFFALLVELMGFLMAYQGGDSWISPMKQVPQMLDDIGCEVMSYNLMGWSSFNANSWKVPGVPLFFNML